MKKIISLLLLSIIFLLSSCSGKVGNEDVSNYKQPELEYRLINNSTAYEIVGLKSNYIGSFIILPTYQGLPVISIADEAFKDKQTIFHIVILGNIFLLGSNAFNGWKQHQTIIFQINETDLEQYKFDDHWNENCEANIVWNEKLDEYKDLYPTDLGNYDQILDDIIEKYKHLFENYGKDYSG